MVRNVLALVVDFRTTDETRNLTAQLAGASRQGFGLTITHVDNGNAEPVSLTEEQRSLGVRLIRVPHNGGYASGLRQAIEAALACGAEFDAIWMLNSDLEIEPDCLQRLVDTLNAHPEVGAIGPNVYKGRSERVWGARGIVSPTLGITGMGPWPRGGVLPRWSYIPGCSLLIRTEAYDAVGGIPDRYGMYYEEAHLCVQLQRAGWELWVEPAAAAYHKVNSMEAGIPARYQAFYFTRNNLYFWRENFGIPWFVQLPRTAFVVVKDLLLPLIRRGSAADIADRTRFIAMGLLDSFEFSRARYTRFERKHFTLEPREPQPRA